MLGDSCTVGDMSPPYIGIRAERSDIFHYSLFTEAPAWTRQGCRALQALKRCLHAGG